MMERKEFIKKLANEFPDAFAQINEYESGLLHCEMGAFSRYIENQMDSGAVWYCEKAFRFIETCLNQAGPDLENAIEVSFIENLALGEHTTQRHEIISARMPKLLRDKMIKIKNDWK